MHSVPRVIITDKLKCYGAAKREILPGVEHRQHKGLNNQAENSHQPTRLREKKMRRFKSARTGTTLSLVLWSHLRPFPTATSPLECTGISCHFTGPIPGMERGNRNEASRINIFLLRSFIALSALPHANSAISFVPTNKLTIPWQILPRLAGIKQRR